MGKISSNLLALILAKDGSTPVAHIMSEWLDMNAIGRLDNAIVSRVGGLREVFLESLKHWSIFNGLRFVCRLVAAARNHRENTTSRFGRTGESNKD